jgi:hypothetical protein
MGVVAAARNRGSAGWRESGIVQTRHWTTYAKDSEHYAKSWVDELTQLAMDPVGREVARKPLPVVQDWFWGTRSEGPLRFTGRSYRPVENVLPEELRGDPARHRFGGSVDARIRGWLEENLPEDEVLIALNREGVARVVDDLQEVTQAGITGGAHGETYRVVERGSLSRGQLGSGAKLRQDLAKAGFDGTRRRWDVTTRQGADAYVSSVLDRLTTKTSSHPDLVSAVATGRLPSGELLTDGVNANPKVTAILRNMADQGIGPEKVKGRITAAAANDSGVVKAARRYDRGAEWLFNELGARPSNRLSRSPVFRQAYWERAEELATLMDDAGRAKLVQAATDANLPKQQVERIRRAVGAQRLEGHLSVEDADRAAKHYALGTTKKLLYDLHEKGQAFDALRIVAPFGEAWREVLTRWARLANPITGNPLVGYRLNQGVGEARKGHVFYPDPTTGEERFAYPGGQLLTDLLTGVPAKVSAPVQSLNTVTGGGTAVLPGFGPVVQLAASAVLPDSPTWDDIRGVVSPYGEQDSSGGWFSKAALVAGVPAYMNKIIAAGGGGTPDQKRQLASTTRDVMAYLYSTGDYDTSPESQAKLIEDAQRKAKYLFFLRGLAQSTAPAAPAYEFAVQGHGRAS